MKSALEFFCRVANINRVLLVVVILGILHLEYVYWTSKKGPTECASVDHSHLDNRLHCHERQIDKLTNQYDSIMNCQYQLNKDVRRTRNLVTLVGSLHNENWCTVANGSNNFLYINHDWTVDRLPKYLQLSNSDKEWFSHYVNKKTHGGHKSIGALAPYDPLDDVIKID